MKTSTRLLFIALLIIVVSLGIHNLALQAEYLKGNYKDVYYNYHKYGFKNFDEIQVNASNQLNVVIRQGDFAVMKQKNADDSIIFTQQGNRLIVDINYLSPPSANTLLNKWNSTVVIVCPKLHLIKTDNNYLVNRKRPNTLNASSNLTFESPFFERHYVELENFSTESLFIEQDRGHLLMKGSYIKSLKADVGSMSTAILNIEDGNTIDEATFNVRNDSKLNLNTIAIPKLDYHVDANAQINITGAMLKSAANNPH